MKAWFPSYMFVRDTYAEQLPHRLKRIVAALRAARAKNIAVDVVLPPVHVSRRAMFDLMGYQQRFRDWKKALSSEGPASTRQTRVLPSSIRRPASVAPPEPPPMMT